MSELQTVTAEVLGMERGVSSDRKHLTALQFKVQAMQKQLEELRQEISSMDVTKAVKQRLLGILNMSGKDKVITQERNEKEQLAKEVADLKEKNKQLRAAVKAEQQKASQEAEKASAATRVRIARAAGLYQARPNQKCGIEELVEDIKAMRSRERSYYLENQELKQENQRLKRDQEPTQQLHR
jgi:HAMP domain-containing protein